MFGPQNLAKFWAQNATKTSAGNIPESLSNLFSRDRCRLSQRLLNNAKTFGDVSGGGGGCTWVKPGQFGSLFVLCFLALGGHCLQMLCLPGFGTHANTQNLPQFRGFPCEYPGALSPEMPIFMANAKLPNGPGFAVLHVRGDSALRGFEKGLAGGGWRPTAPKIQQKLSPRIVFSYSKGGGHRTKCPEKEA